MRDYSSHSDSLLVTLLKDSDNAAFTELYNRYWSRMLLVAGNKLGSVVEAQEVVQDIFVDLWSRRQELAITGAGGIRAYLATAVKYRVINVLGRRSRIARFMKEKQAVSIEGGHPVEEWLSFEELKDRLAELVAALPERRRLVFQLSREKGYSRREIANTLNITEKAVESHLTRALKSIRAGLSHLFSTFFSMLP